MDNLDDSEKNAKVSDSGYSNSCSNSQSRRSHSSKSTHSGSHSSGSSGYGGKPSTSSSGQPSEKRVKDKDSKKKKQQALAVEATEAEQVSSQSIETPPLHDSQNDLNTNVDQTPAPVRLAEDPQPMDVASPQSDAKVEDVVASAPLAISTATNRPNPTYCSDGFSCVISMHDGVVMYTTSSLTTTLGFPKDIWIGRSFIDFIHPHDRSTFASQITNGLAAPNVNGTQETVQTSGNAVSTMVCRIRRYRGLASGFGVKERIVTFMPFLLKLTFKNVSSEDGEVIYLVIQATQFFSAFKICNEILTKSTPFVMRHAANGNLEYIDPESVPYLGYMPQDVIGTDALLLYHPDDLCYLKQVYETIVKEGGLPNSKPYRMMAQNGDYIKLETEWSSFINPWSRKLEFVIGKHHIIEGPINPDVFHVPEKEKPSKMVEEDKKQHQALREQILKIMNEVLTKPAEVAKQQMSKRCQDLASFMESLMEEPVKSDDELRVDIQEPEHNYYERDSMLGGISPHHDYNDSKSSTETPLSYNQLNYNDTLQRYFASHQPFSYDDYNTVTGENILGLKSSVRVQPASNCLSPMGHYSGDSADVLSSTESGLVMRGSSPTVPQDDYHQQVRLTESLLTKHNAEMEKELMKQHREMRTSTREEREKTSSRNRQKKKEHLARCKAPYQPTAAGETAEVIKSHGVKRPSKQPDPELVVANKYQCASPKQQRRRTQLAANQPLANQPSTSANSTAASTNWQPNAVTTTSAHWYPNPDTDTATLWQQTTTVTDTTTHWHQSPVTDVNSYLLGMGMPQRVPIVGPMLPRPVAPIPAITAVNTVPGMYPMYYTPATPSPMPSVGETMSEASQLNPQYPSGVQCLLYDQGVYGTPFVYNAMTSATQLGYSVQPNMLHSSLANPYSALHPLGLAHRNYEEVCKPSLPVRPIASKPLGAWREKKWSVDAPPQSSAEHSNESCSSSNLVNQSTSATPQSSSDNMKYRQRGSEMDRTDGESSYSSFYSSFFKTETGSAEGSLDVKKNKQEAEINGQAQMDTSSDVYMPVKQNNLRRKMVPPWIEQVCVTSDLMYKYQVLTKSTEETLLADKEKMSKFVQPSLVIKQLDQLYIDMQLEGVAARLTLEEGGTSSSSSGEETVANTTKRLRRKREYSKLMMIYEEDAPFPPTPTSSEL